MQGLAAAAATREAAKRKGHSAEDKAQPKKARRVPIISHEVAIPKGYVAKDLSEELHGASYAPPSIQKCNNFYVKSFMVRPMPILLIKNATTFIWQTVQSQREHAKPCQMLRQGVVLCAQSLSYPKADMPCRY